MNLPDENSYRFVTVLNKKIETSKLMNALGHMTAGLVGGYHDAKEMYFLEYKDKDGGIHPTISHFPFIILAADNSNQIRTTRREAINRGIAYADFTSTMTVGTSLEQVNRTANTLEADLEYYGIVLFGELYVLQPLTKKFSLFR